MSDHYCCRRCGLRYDDCRCQSTSTPSPSGFIVDNSYAVVPASVLATKDGLATKDWLAYMFAKNFETRELAETAALAAIESDIDAMEAELVTLRELRKAMK